MNPVIMLTLNNLALTKKAVKSVLAQDVGDITMLVIDNGSSDGTWEYLYGISSSKVRVVFNRPAKSVAASWNFGLSFCFNAFRESHALVLNNDIELRPDTYRHLLADGGGFVTAVGSNDPMKIIAAFAPGPDGILRPALEWPDPAKKRPHPDFSCFLIRKEVFERVGPFDERFEGAFAEDWDMHCRLHQAGIPAMSLDLPFYHHGSATINAADPVAVRRIQIQADKNREYFKRKWGFAGASPEYEAYFKSPASE